MGFNLADYEPVENRIRFFWKDHPEGRIECILVEHGDGSYIMKALVYRNAEDARPAATGIASETETERGVNSTSALENCETSAIGRALANMGYAPKGKRPSREEMSKAQRPTRSGSTPSAAPEPVEVGRVGEGAPASTGTIYAPPAPPPPPAHDHEWVPSPRLSKIDVCAVEGCLETRRRPTVHTEPTEERADLK